MALEISVAIKATLVLELLGLLSHRLKEGLTYPDNKDSDFWNGVHYRFLVRTCETRQKTELLCSESHFKEIGSIKMSVQGFLFL